jgi:hypothetical protein
VCTLCRATPRITEGRSDTTIARQCVLAVIGVLGYLTFDKSFRSVPLSYHSTESESVSHCDSVLNKHCWTLLDIGSHCDWQSLTGSQSLEPERPMSCWRGAPIRIRLCSAHVCARVPCTKLTNFVWSCAHISAHFSLFVFMTWQITSSPTIGQITDKGIVSALFCILICYRFPISLLSLLSGVIDLCVWNSDRIGLHQEWIRETLS